MPQALGLQRVEPRHGPVREGKVECNACPVLCHISEGRVGACDRYANHDGLLVRLDPVVFLSQQVQSTEPLSLQARPDAETSPQTLASVDSAERGVFVTGIGASTTYPDYKPAPFIVAAKSKGVDMVTVVTEGIFSYCSLKVKIDTDRYLGDERAAVLYQGEEVDTEKMERMLCLFSMHFLEPNDMSAQIRGKPVYLAMAMDAENRLKLKPQNLLLNLPLAKRS
jgi:hypothetical protein